MTPGNAEGQSHSDVAAAFEDRAETDLRAAATCPVGDPEGPELLADAQAAATLALSHRTAEQTELWGSLVRRTERSSYGEGSLFLSVKRP